MAVSEECGEIEQILPTSLKAIFRQLVDGVGFKEVNYK